MYTFATNAEIVGQFLAKATPLSPITLLSSLYLYIFVLLLLVHTYIH